MRYIFVLLFLVIVVNINSLIIEEIVRGRVCSDIIFFFWAERED